MLAERSLRVVVLERENEPLKRASFSNQARIHGGYHYPRSILTGLRSSVNLPRFIEDYGDCVVDDFEHYYAISRQFSNVTARQFELFCERIRAPLKRAPARVRTLFNDDLIEEVFVVREPAFDAAKLRAHLGRRLAEARVEVRTGQTARSVQRAGAGRSTVHVLAHGGETVLNSSLVFNCTYAAINAVVAGSGLPRVPLKLELAELALVEPPAALKRAAVTVMCGPFFSLMPFPSRGLHTLSHVRYTPHLAWEEREKAGPPEALPARATHFDRMVRDASRYLPLIGECRYRESLFEVKALLPQAEGNDARPILFKQHVELPGLYSVMGGKIDNVYDLPRELDLLPMPMPITRATA